MNARPSIPAQGRGQPRLDSAIVLAALPVPAVVLNAEDRFTFVTALLNNSSNYPRARFARCGLAIFCRGITAFFLFWRKSGGLMRRFRIMIFCLKARASIAAAFPFTAHLCMKLKALWC